MFAFRIQTSAIWNSMANIQRAKTLLHYQGCSCYLKLTSLEQLSTEFQVPVFAESHVNGYRQVFCITQSSECKNGEKHQLVTSESDPKIIKPSICVFSNSKIICVSKHVKK